MVDAAPPSPCFCGEPRAPDSEYYCSTKCAREDALNSLTHGPTTDQELPPLPDTPSSSMSKRVSSSSSSGWASHYRRVYAKQEENEENLLSLANTSTTPITPAQSNHSRNSSLSSSASATSRFTAASHSTTRTSVSGLSRGPSTRSNKSIKTGQGEWLSRSSSIREEDETNSNLDVPPSPTKAKKKKTTKKKLQDPIYTKTMQEVLDDLARSEEFMTRMMDSCLNEDAIVPFQNSSEPPIVFEPIPDTPPQIMSAEARISKFNPNPAAAAYLLGTPAQQHLPSSPDSRRMYRASGSTFSRLPIGPTQSRSRLHTASPNRVSHAPTATQSLLAPPQSHLGNGTHRLAPSQFPASPVHSPLMTASSTSQTPSPRPRPHPITTTFTLSRMHPDARKPILISPASAARLAAALNTPTSAGPLTPLNEDEDQLDYVTTDSSTIFLHEADFSEGGSEPTSGSVSESEVMPCKLEELSGGDYSDDESDAVFHMVQRLRLEMSCQQGLGLGLGVEG